jgi:hypothetical protein
VSEALRLRRERGVSLEEHLEALRANDLKEVYAFWSGGEAPDLPRREMVRQLTDLMRDESTVYRRVRTLTRKVVDVLLRFLRRPDYASDLPGLFRRLPGDEPEAPLEYHEAETGLRALARRGFLAERPGRALALSGRVLHAVPLELGDLLAAVFREETRTPKSVFSLRGHLATLPLRDREAMRARFPALGAHPGGDDVAAVLGGEGGARALVASLDPVSLRDLVALAVERGGVLLRAEAPAPLAAGWDRRALGKALERGGVGTVTRLALGDYGIACEDEALVVFEEVLDDLLAGPGTEPEPDEVLQAGGDLAADLLHFLATVRREPLRVTKEGGLHLAAKKRVQSGFVFRESPIVSRAEVFEEIRRAADALGLVTVDPQGFLACRDPAERFAGLPLEEKILGVYRTALERPGPQGTRSLHQHELRAVVEEVLRERPRRWWPGDALASVARARYLATLDERRIRDRHRDRHFSAFQSGREGLGDLLKGVRDGWTRALHVFGILDVATKDGRPAAFRLSSLGERILGAPAEGIATGLRPLLVSPDFEVVVLPEGDVSDVVHRLDAYAQRVRTGDVVHFRLTKESVESAVADGRRVEDLLEFLEARSRSPLPQNVAYSLRDWASSVAFATLERGVVLRVEAPEVLDRALAVPGLEALLVRRLGPTDALLREEPSDRRTLADLRAAGVRVRDA